MSCPPLKLALEDLERRDACAPSLLSAQYGVVLHTAAQSLRQLWRTASRHHAPRRYRSYFKLMSSMMDIECLAVPCSLKWISIHLTYHLILSYSIIFYQLFYQLFSSRSSAAASPAAGNKKPYSRRTPADDSERIWKWLQGWMPRRRLTAHIFRSLVRLSIE